ncbi:phosphoribosyltransferase [Candidatus Gottesmanbacteria bacterium]|nr:phosphoribosyltransferase [Candidatus Gottesmanbacteria bacterium]
MFKNREEAGRLLANRLGHLKGKNIVVLAIPRGGVVVGKILSQNLGCPLDVLVVKKVGAPGNPELAVGAMGPDEVVVWNFDILRSLGLTPEDLNEEIQNLKVKIQNYLEKFKTGKLDLKGKTVILTDDGIATGATTEAAIAWIKRQEPAKIVLAVPVAPPETVGKFKNLVDELIVLETPAFFGAVGQFYEEFPQVEDEEVIQLLRG